MKKYITKTIVLDKQDLDAVNQYAEKKGLDNQRGFSASIRGIIREWNELKNKHNEKPGEES